MASVRKHPQRKGWQVRWRDGDGRRGAQHTRYLARREDAKLFRAEIGQALARGTYIDPVLGRVTLAAWWERYFSDADLAPRGARFKRALAARDREPPCCA